jgi:hypothetical protein
VPATHGGDGNVRTVLPWCAKTASHSPEACLDKASRFIGSLLGQTEKGFRTGLLLAKRTAEDGGPPSAQAKAHSQVRALVAPAISAWLALLRDGGEVPQQLWGRSTPLDAERPLRGNNPDFVEAFRLCGEGLLVNGKAFLPFPPRHALLALMVVLMSM